MPYPCRAGRRGRPAATEDRILPPRPSRRSTIPTQPLPSPTPPSPQSVDPSDIPPEGAGPDLAGAEELVASLRGIGAMLFVTTQRLIVARDGQERRPRSGVQSFPLDRISHIRLEPGAPPSGRIAIWVGGQEAVSMFFDARSRVRAQEVVDLARPLIARRRRERAAMTRRISG
jgi:hypothetical protein